MNALSLRALAVILSFSLAWTPVASAQLGRALPKAPLAVKTAAFATSLPRLHPRLLTPSRLSTLSLESEETAASSALTLTRLSSDVRAAQQAPAAEAPDQWNRFFDQAAPQNAGIESAVNLPTDAPPASLASTGLRPAAAPRSETKSATFLGLAPVAALSGVDAIGDYFRQVWSNWGPTLQGTGVLVGTAFADRYVRRLTDRLTGSASPRVKLWTRWGARAALWSGGSVLAMNRLGVPLPDIRTALFTGAGIGALALTFGFKDLISDYLSGAQVLLTRPFDVGDEIRVSANGKLENFFIEDMNMKEMVLRPTASPEELTRINYSSLAARPVMVMGVYKKRYIWQNLWAEKNRSFVNPQRNPLEPWVKYYFPFLGLMGLMAASAWIAQPLLFGAATAVLTTLAERRFAKVVNYWQESGVLTKNAGSVLRRFGTIALYAVGTTRVLDVFGFTWPTVLTGSGLTAGRTVVASIVGGATIFGSGDSIKNFFRGLHLIATQPFHLGDHIMIEGVRGRVEDITLRNVVLALEDGSGHALIPTQLATSWAKIK